MTCPVRTVKLSPILEPRHAVIIDRDSAIRCDDYGLLRHAMFDGVCEDNSSREVMRET
jgi:hypothetical protein